MYYIVASSGNNKKLQIIISVVSNRNIIDTCLRCLWTRLEETFPLTCNMPGFRLGVRVRHGLALGLGLGLGLGLVPRIISARNVVYTCLRCLWTLFPLICNMARVRS